MSDKFLGSGQGSINLSNGSATIYSTTLGAASLTASKPIKTNSVKQLVSANLDITDVNNLQTQLNEKDELTFIENDTHTNPVAGQVKLYVKTDGNFYKKDSAGNESGLGGGPYCATTNAPVVDNSVVFYDGTSGGLVKQVAGIRYDAVNNTLEVNDLETAETFSLNGEIQKINNITSATQVAPFITNFQGEIHVAKIKSATPFIGTELEFEAGGTATLTADGDINLITATGDIELNGNSISATGGTSFTYNGKPLIADNSTLPSTTKNGIARYSNVNGTEIKDSPTLVSDAGDMTFPGGAYCSVNVLKCVYIDPELGYTGDLFIGQAGGFQNVRIDAVNSIILTNGGNPGNYTSVNNNFKIANTTFEELGGNLFIQNQGVGNITFETVPQVLPAYVFSNPYELVSKKYVDDAIQGAAQNIQELQDKTQNIDASGLTTSSLTSLTKAIEIRSGSSYDNQFNFWDTSQTRTNPAVGFIAGNGSDGLKWILGGAGDLNSVLFRTYTANDNILIQTNDDPTLKINANGTIQLERAGVYDGTTDAILKLNTNGTLEKSSATVSTTGDFSTSGYVNATQFREGGSIGAIFRNPNTDNYFLGFGAGSFYNSGGSNLFMGQEAGRDCNNSFGNIGIGYQALKFSQSTNNNQAIGTQSQLGVSATSTGTYNTSMGTFSLYSITTGSGNVALGGDAGFSITTGSNNTCIGRSSGDSANMNNSTSLGANARPNDGTNRTALGYQANCDTDNQVCIGNGSTTQIINTGNGVCDLGSTTHEFKDIHFSGNLIQDGSTLPPARNVYKGSAGSTATVYEDDKVRFIWNASTRQPQYQVKVAPFGGWVNGGIQLTHDPPLRQEFITEVDDLSTAINTSFYFTTSGSRNISFDMSNYGNLATTWLIAEADTTYPAYFCRWITGSITASLCAIIERN